MRETLHVREAAELARLVDRLAASADETLALDTEFLRERTFYPKLCLVQIATADVEAIIDPLACGDIASLLELIVDRFTLLLHAGSQDLEILLHSIGRLPRRVFDTQVAAAFVGYGDSLSHARMVERCLGRRVSRSEAYTDWARRPLSSEQLEYALDDVRHLHECHDHLQSELEARGRLTWVEEELVKLVARVEQLVQPNDRWRKVAGARSLKGGELAVLREITTWREREAMSRDIPRQRVVPDRVLVQIARRAPKSQEQLDQLRGLHPREAQRSGRRILEVVSTGLSTAENDYPRWLSPPSKRDEEGVYAIASLLDAYLRSRSQELQLSSRLLASRNDLVSLAGRTSRGEQTDASRSGDKPQLAILEGWRREVVGEDLLRLLEGKIALRLERADDGSAGLRLVASDS